MGPVVQGLKALAACCIDVDLVALIEEDENVPAVWLIRCAGRQAWSRRSHVLARRSAVHHCCSNPGCSNTVGLSEASIVSGKGSVCAGCKVARYCGKPCHVAHKRVCAALAAAKRCGSGSELHDGWLLSLCHVVLCYAHAPLSKQCNVRVAITHSLAC
jgi:hypothetical protein